MATFVLTRAGTSNTAPWPQSKSEKLTTHPGSDLRQLEIQHNSLMNNVAAAMGILGGCGPITTSMPSRGTTVTVACSASTVSINGVTAVVAAETAKAFGSLGTIPQNTWGLIVLERIANGTTTFVSAADNYTTGYATEALAIAAMPANSANKAVVGYVTIMPDHASGWVAGTDALAGGSGGNPALYTNYYPVYGIADALFWTSYQIANREGTVLTSANY